MNVSAIGTVPTKRPSIGVVLLIVGMLTMVIIPLPAIILDFLFTFNITLSLLILTVCIYVVRPLDFSLFPTVLLITTLLRLTLNVASTRVILLHGHEGADAAGAVIKAFGEVVIGGNFLVGMIIFAILMIINFVVVTKGSGRISEVSARFTLDAMPGKQMSIDADLAAGVIEQSEAKARRKEIISEADFYGSMDGASKFVRGDAVAGLLILFINLIGGIIVGVVQNNMNFNQAMMNFSILTIGDGLVAQIPSLLLSISAAIMVTRVSNEQDISEQTVSQLFKNPKPLMLTAIILFCLALIPDMPHLPLFLFSLLALLLSYRIASPAMQKKLAVIETPHTSSLTPSALMHTDVDWSDVVLADRVALEIGYGIISLIGIKRDGPLIARIKGLRKKISQELGFLIPSVHVKDNLDLPSNHYLIFIKGAVVAESCIYADRKLAISAGLAKIPLPGIACKDPSFNLDGFWITPEFTEDAEESGYTVVDASTVIATHLNQIIRQNAFQILGYDEVQQLINRLTQTDPKLAETLTSSIHGIPLNTVVWVLQKLLQSDIPIIDFRTIAEKMINAWATLKDNEHLLESVRVALRQLIIYSICGYDKEISVAVIDNELNQILLKSSQINVGKPDKIAMIDPGLTESILNGLLEYVRYCELHSLPIILLVHNELRNMLENIFKSSIPTMHFLAFSEIAENRRVKIVQRIGH